MYPPKNPDESPEEYAERLFREPVDANLDVVEQRITYLESIGQLGQLDLEELVAIARDLMWRVIWWESFTAPNICHAPTQAYNEAMMNALDAPDPPIDFTDRRGPIEMVYRAEKD